MRFEVGTSHWIGEVKVCFSGCTRFGVKPSRTVVGRIQIPSLSAVFGGELELGFSVGY